MREQAQIIRWEDPPPPSRRGRGGGRPAVAARAVQRPARGERWVQVAAELRVRRGMWAVVLETASPRSIAAQISLGRLEPFVPAGDFGAVSRKVGAVYAVYARYLGDGDA